MHFPIGIPLVVRNVKIGGPRGFVNVDLILDTGAVVTALSWAVLKVIGYDPAIAPERRLYHRYRVIHHPLLANRQCTNGVRA